MSDKDAAITVVQEPRELSIQELKHQADLIKQAIKEVMVENHHFGKIPGCGDKPTLLKPGAEKLCLLFRLAPKYEIITGGLTGGHREYEVICNLIHISTGQFVGQGVGICSTMESKYRYRTGPVEYTDKAVPKDYWKERDIKLIGGKGFCAKKHPDTGNWVICIQGEKIENPNPADEYNTVKKMAKKRALVDATLTVTAASDSFTQDLEDIQKNQNNPEATKESSTKNQSEQPEPGEQDSPLTKAKKLFTKVFKQLSEVDPDKYNKTWENQYLKGAFGVDSIWKCKIKQLDKMREEYKQLEELVEVCTSEDNNEN